MFDSNKLWIIGCYWDDTKSFPSVFSVPNRASLHSWAAKGPDRFPVVMLHMPNYTPPVLKSSSLTMEQAGMVWGPHLMCAAATQWVSCSQCIQFLWTETLVSLHFIQAVATVVFIVFWFAHNRWLLNVQLSFCWWQIWVKWWQMSAWRKELLGDMLSLKPWLMIIYTLCMCALSPDLSQ